jgi:hypothetical protein
VPQWVFVVILLAVLAVPLVLMPVLSPSAEDASSEKRELAPAPRLVVDGVANPRVMVEAGNYFADHFALRSQLVDLDTSIKQSVWLTSSIKNVVVGSDGWLYYAGELGDYQRTSVLSDRGLNNAAHNLAMVQEVLEEEGKRFVVAIAPNKSTLYPAHLPYYEIAGEGQSNYERLLPLLRQYGVHVVDLRETIGKIDGEMYLKRDSHWTDAGALKAFEAIRVALERNPELPGNQNVSTVARVGDLDGMLHPTSASPEEQAHLDDVDQFSFVSDATDVEDNYLVTNSTDGDAQGSLLMYRDSFGNTLLPPFASVYRQAAFTKLVPYDVSERMYSFADDVVIERAERHLSFFATTPPYMAAPERSIGEEGDATGSQTSVCLGVNGPYLVVEGTLDETAVPDDAHVFVEVTLPEDESRTYEAFRVSEATQGAGDFEGQAPQTSQNIVGDWGYRVYVPLDEQTDVVPQGCRARVLVGTTDHAIEVGSVTQ